MGTDIGRFASLPPQGYTYMTPLERFDHKVRCAVLEVLGTRTAGTWNVNEALRQIMVDVDGLSADAPPETTLAK